MELDLHIVDLARELVLTVIIISGPIMLVGLLVGLSVSLFQTLTSVQEQTLSFVPKMLAVMVTTLILLAPALKYLSDYTERLIARMSEFGLS